MSPEDRAAVLAELGRLWERAPDLRLGELFFFALSGSTRIPRRLSDALDARDRACGVALHMRSDSALLADLGLYVEQRSRSTLSP